MHAYRTTMGAGRGPVRGTLRGRWRGVVVACVGVALSGLLVLPPTAPASAVGADGGVAVHGVVLGLDETREPVAQPLAGARVSAYDRATGAILQAVLTAADGTFRFRSLSADEVALRVSRSGYLTTSAFGRGDLRSADSVRLDGAYGGLVEVDPVTIAKEAVIEGEVLGWMDPLAGATVQAVDAVTGRVVRSVTLGEYVYEYRLDRLPAGAYKLHAFGVPGWLPDWADNRDSFATASVFTLVPGQVLTQDPDTLSPYLDLEPAARVVGVVTGEGAPLAGATVTVLDLVGTRLASARTRADGTYQVDVPVTSDIEQPVRVRVSAPGWSTVMVPGTLGIFRFRAVVVPPVDLVRTGTLIGSVLGIDESPEGAYDAPLPGVRVTAYDATTGAAIASVLTDADGDYRFASLPAGGVKVRAARPGWITTFALASRDLAGAETYLVTPGGTTELPEITLYAEVTVSGLVMGFSGGDEPWDDPLPGVRVVVLDVATGRAVASAVTGSSADPAGYGRFAIRGLPYGRYLVRATAPGWSTSYAPGVERRADAQVYELNAGADLVVDPWSVYRDAAVSGQVLGWMDPLAGARVTVVDAATGRVLRTTTSDSSGEYRVDGLVTGPDVLRIKVQGAKDGWLSMWADGSRTMSGARVFEVRAGEVLRQSWDPVALLIDLAPSTVPTPS